VKVSTVSVGSWIDAFIVKQVSAAANGPARRAVSFPQESVPKIKINDTIN